MVETFDVVVQTLCSNSFAVTMESSDNGVRSLKEAIQDAQGAEPYLQELFLAPQPVSSGASPKNSEATILENHGTIDGLSTVLLSVKVETGLCEG